jgi:hypothetical protein
MSDPRKNPEIVTEQELQPVLKNTAFDSAKFLEMYKQWKETEDSHIFAQLRAMHESAGYNNKNNFKWAEDEMHEIAAIVEKYHVGKVQAKEQVDEWKNDILGNLAIKKQQEQEIRDALNEEIKKLDGNLETMTMQDLDKAIDESISILSMTWIEQVPWMKEMGKELLKYEPMIQWTVGKIILQRLEQLGYYVQFTDKNKVKVVAHESKIQDEQEVAIKLNTYLAKNAVLGKALQSWSLYLQPSFSAFRDATLNQDGAIVDPAKVDLKSYVEYLRTKPSRERTVQEKLFLQTEQYFDSGIDFQKLLLQKSDHNKVESMMQQMWINWSPSSWVNPSSAVDTGMPQSAFSWDRSSGVSSAAWAVGQWIGKVGWIIGKLAGAGAGGGIRVLTEVFSEATKHWGAWWALAVIGGLIWSIWKGPGFWWTLGGLFGIWLIDSAARKELTWLMWESANTPSNPWSNPADTSSTEAAGTTSSTPDITSESSQSFTGPLTENIFLARALGRTGNLNEANVAPELAVIQTIKWLNFQLLQKALASRTHSDFQKLFEQYFPQASTVEMEAIKKVMSSENSQARKTIESWVNAVANHQSYNNLKMDSSFGNMSIGQVMEYLIKQENTLTQEWSHTEIVPWVPLPRSWELESIIKDNAAYGDLFVVARMVEYGYLPKINFTLSEVTSKEWLLLRFLKWVIYVWLAWPLTNNEPWKNWFSWKHRQYEENFYKWLDEKIKLEKSQIQSQNNESWKTGISGLKNEIQSRAEVLNNLEKAMYSKDSWAIKKALSAYREVAKIPFYKSHLWSNDAFVNSENIKIQKLHTIYHEIDKSHKHMLEKQELANKESATVLQKAEAMKAVEEHNMKVQELEKNGVKWIAEMSPETREMAVKSNKWAERFAKANWWLAKLNEKLADYSSKWIWKGIMWVGLVWLIWNNKWSITEAWEKGDYATLSKLGWDFAAGAVPIVSSFHETAMLSNAFGYKDFILGNGYEMSSLEKWFRVAWAIPLWWLITKGAGKAILAVGEKTSIGIVKTAWTVIEWVSETTVKSVQMIGQTATYGILGYSAATFTYDLFPSKTK